MAKAKKKHNQPERSFWASFWIVIIALHAIGMAFVEIFVLRGPDEVNRPVIIGILLISSLATIVAMFGIWRWKEWGLYLYAITVVISLTVGLILTASQLFVFSRIILPAFLGWTLKDKWENFD
jgi:hypothetical protein